MTINTGKLADSPSVLTKEFHTIYGQAIRTNPIYLIPELNMRISALKEEVYELVDAYKIKSLVDMADALGDTLYIAFGTAHAHGFSDALDASFTGFGQSPSTKLYDSFVLEGHVAATVPNLEHPDLPRAIERLTSLVDEYEAYVEDHQEDGDVRKIQEFVTYIVTGAYYTSFIIGLNLDDVLVHIQESNMSKLDENGKPIYREDGKVLKGPNFFKPEPKIEALIQSWGGDTRTLLDIEEEAKAEAALAEAERQAAIAEAEAAAILAEEERKAAEAREEVAAVLAEEERKAAEKAVEAEEVLTQVEEDLINAEEEMSSIAGNTEEEIVSDETETEISTEVSDDEEILAEAILDTVEEPLAEDEGEVGPVTAPIASRTFDSYRSANEKDKMTTSMFSEMKEAMAAEEKLFEETTGTIEAEEEEVLSQDDISTIAIDIVSETVETSPETSDDDEAEEVLDETNENSEEALDETDEEPKNPEEIEVPKASDDEISDDMFNIDINKKL